MSKRPWLENNEDNQAVKESEVVAELAPDAKTKREAQGVIETIEGNGQTVQEQERLLLENNINKLYNPFVHTNTQLVTNGLEIATESMKILNEYILRIMNFNMNAMRMWWIPFYLNLLEAEEKVL